MQRIILASSIEKAEIAKKSACYCRKDIDLNKLLKSYVEKLDDLVRLFEKAEGHQAVVAVNEHGLCALE